MPGALLAEMLADSPRGCWMMETTTDESGNGLTLTDVSSPPTAASMIPRVLTLSRDFDGVADTCTRASGTGLDLGDVFTLEAWIQLDALPGASAAFTVLCRTDSYQMFIWNDGTRGFFGLSQNNVGSCVDATVSVASNGVTRHHIVATKNGATVKLYQDGNDVTGTVTNRTFTNPATAFYIASAGGGSEFLNGRIQAAAIYPTALSADRVLAHYLAGVTTYLNPANTSKFPRPKLRRT